MTSNATAYFNVVEQGRSNRAQEAETHRKNVASEQHNAAVLAETNRHNLVVEQQQRDQLAESVRHSLAQESIGWGNLDLDWSRLAETGRANRAAEAELRRSHLVQETEAMRHNRMTELTGGISSGANLISSLGSYRQSKAAALQAATARERSSWEKSQGEHRIVQGYLRSATDLGNFVNNWRNATTNRLRVGVDVGKMLLDFKSKKLFGK